MRTELEQRFAAYLMARDGFPRDWIVARLEDGELQSPKQAWRTLEKWADRGWYDYGVTLDLGWITHAGKARFAAHGRL